MQMDLINKQYIAANYIRESSAEVSVQLKFFEKTPVWKFDTWPAISRMRVSWLPSHQYSTSSNFIELDRVKR